MIINDAFMENIVMTIILAGILTFIVGINTKNKFLDFICNFLFGAEVLALIISLFAWIWIN